MSASAAKADGVTTVPSTEKDRPLSPRELARLQEGSAAAAAGDGIEASQFVTQMKHLLQSRA